MSDVSKTNFSTFRPSVDPEVKVLGLPNPLSRYASQRDLGKNNAEHVFWSTYLDYLQYAQEMTFWFTCLDRPEVVQTPCSKLHSESPTECLEIGWRSVPQCLALGSKCPRCPAVGSVWKVFRGPSKAQSLKGPKPKDSLRDTPSDTPPSGDTLSETLGGHSRPTGSCKDK